MGFGCNAVGVTGARIIDSPRERLMAILTNSFMPCNGRFPMIISIITMFFIVGTGFASSLKSAVIMTGFIVFGIVVTFLTTKILSKTLLRGIPSSYTLELPPYRVPQFTKVLVNSVFDRTVFVLARAIVVAVPAGLVIWLMANVYVGDKSIILICAELLNPLGTIMGLDGAILLAFILGLPANEIVIPIVIMIYMATGNIGTLSGVDQTRQLFLENGWTNTTALCTILFSLFHWPCSTTILTVKKETNSFKWTIASILIPTLIGFLLCTITAQILR